jgi:uncharacterized membrane protein YiaA
MAKNKTRDNNWLKIRWLIALLGIYLLIVGLWKISFQVHPEIPSLLLFVAGGLLLVLAYPGIPFLLILKENFRKNPLTLKSLWPRMRWLVKYPVRREKTVSKRDTTRLVSTPTDQEGYKRFYPALEILVIIIWALWVGRSYLVLDPNLSLGRGNDDYLISVFPYFPLTRLLNCGDCVLWNGLLNGGSPTFGDPIGALFHPVMAPIILFFGVFNGIKVAMLAALIMGGMALWWLAKVLKLGPIPRLWIALMGVAGGNLAGPLYSGDVGIVFSVAATGLVIPPALTLALYGRRRDAIIFGLVLAQALLSGQGYLQLALVFCVLPVLMIFIFDGHFKPSPIWKEFLIGLVIALLIAAVFLLPEFTLASKIVKPTDPQSSEPLEYLPINLIVHDTSFFLSTDLKKLASPNLYEDYIGWIPIILAVIAWGLISRKMLRIYLFFIIGIFLIYLLGSAEFSTWIRGNLHNLLSDIRNLTFGVGLAVTLILGLGAWGLDLIFKFDWPSVELSSLNKTFYRFDTRILLLPLLCWSLFSVYQYNDQFHFTVPGSTDIVRAAESISPSPAEWVSPIYGNWAFTAAAINHNVKITNGYRIWDLSNRLYPGMFMDVGTDPNMKADPHYKYSVDTINFITHPENQYASIDTGTLKVPCTANADGGHIDVHCQSDQAGILVVQENALPGWVAWRDEKKITLLPNQWLSVDALAGDHTYKFRYHPWDVPVGILLSFTGLALAAWLWFKPQPEPIPGLASLDDQKGLPR